MIDGPRVFPCLFRPRFSFRAAYLVELLEKIGRQVGLPNFTPHCRGDAILENESSEVLL
jgi:Fe-S oxidoreductase